MRKPVDRQTELQKTGISSLVMLQTATRISVFPEEWHMSRLAHRWSYQQSTVA